MDGPVVKVMQLTAQDKWLNTKYNVRANCTSSKRTQVKSGVDITFNPIWNITHVCVIAVTISPRQREMSMLRYEL